MWSEARQECAMEAFQKLCEACHSVDEDAVQRIPDCGSRANTASVRTYPSWAIFGGILESEVRCDMTTCGRICRKYEMITHVQVSVPRGPSVTLAAAIEEAQAWEKLSSSTCPECHNSSRSKRLRIIQWPSCLVIHVKRWQLSPRGHRWVKDYRGLAFDEQMHTGGIMYGLKAVVCHLGGVNNGHYICYARHDNTWHRCDDEHVRPCTCADVLKEQAYMLFYDTIPHAGWMVVGGDCG